MLKSKINPNISGAHTKLIFTFLFFIFLSTNVFSQFTQEWVSRYNGTGNGSDYIKSLAVDYVGNVYITGRSYGGPSGSDQFDIATIKYNSSGDSLWVRRYDGQNNWLDDANSVAVDNLGNVYVAGYTTCPGLQDYTTIKYNSNGDLLWVRLYDGPDSDVDISTSMVIDNSGNVFVTGLSTTTNLTFDFDYATIKYNTSGAQQWVKRYTGPGLGDEVPSSIAIDGQGNVYVTGHSDGDVGHGTNNDYVTIKYNASGGQQWLRRYNGPGNGSDGASKITVDDSGYVYVTGSSEGDYVTIKYNSSGDSLWVSRYNGPGNGSDGASSLALDKYGNFYVTGSSTGNGTDKDFTTIKYNSNGDTLWVRRYNGPGNGSDGASSIALDKYCNVYVAGSSVGNGTGSDIAIIKYNTYGDELWVERYNGPGNGSDGASSIKVDSSRVVYVAGSSTGNGTGSDYVTIKYSQSPPIPSAPVLVLPVNGDTLLRRNPLLKWDRSIYAESYQIQVSTDSLFTSMVYDSSGITILEFQIPLNGLNNNTTYYWRVNSTNLSGTGPWSSIFHFRVSVPLLTAFNLSSPPNGVQINTSPYIDTLIYMKWTRSGDFTTYKWKFGSPTIANPILTLESDNFGYDSMLSIRNSNLDSVLASNGVQPGEVKVGEWAVWAYNGYDSLKSTQTWSMTLRRRAITVLFYDLFSEGTGKWTITNDGGDCVWQIFSAPYPNVYSLPPTSVSPVFSADGAYCGLATATRTTATVANDINCIGYEDITLEFDNDWVSIFQFWNDSALVEVSYNGGTTWTPIIAWGYGEVRNIHITKQLPDASHIPDLKIRFRTEQNYGTTVLTWWTIDNVIVRGDFVTGFAKKESKIPMEYALLQNFPNPFNPSTKIKFDIPKSSYVKLIVYDVLGREITTLVNEKLNAGRYEINWAGSNYPSGVYFYKLVTSEYVDVKKMILLK